MFNLLPNDFPNHCNSSATDDCKPHFASGYDHILLPFFGFHQFISPHYPSRVPLIRYTQNLQPLFGSLCNHSLRSPQHVPYMLLPLIIPFCVHLINKLTAKSFDFNEEGLGNGRLYPQKYNDLLVYFTFLSVVVYTSFILLTRYTILFIYLMYTLLNFTGKDRANT
jgi:hypothetical protein